MQEDHNPRKLLEKKVKEFKGELHRWVKENLEFRPEESFLVAITIGRDKIKHRDPREGFYVKTCVKKRLRRHRDTDEVATTELGDEDRRNISAISWNEEQRHVVNMFLFNMNTPMSVATLRYLLSRSHKRAANERRVLKIVQEVQFKLNVSSDTYRLRMIAEDSNNRKVDVMDKRFRIYVFNPPTDTAQ
jgi:hypothetical protein